MKKGMFKNLIKNLEPPLAGIEKQDEFDAFLDLELRCLICGQRIEILNPVFDTTDGLSRITGVIVNAERITFDDGMTSFLCLDCIIGQSE
jgi:hypothetical protein